MLNLKEAYICLFLIAARSIYFQGMALEKYTLSEYYNDDRFIKMQMGKILKGKTEIPSSFIQPRLVWNLCAPDKRRYLEKRLHAMEVNGGRHFSKYIWLKLECKCMEFSANWSVAWDYILVKWHVCSPFMAGLDLKKKRMRKNGARGHQTVGCRVSFIAKQTPFGRMSHQRRAPFRLVRVSPGSTVGGCKHLHWEAVRSTWFFLTSNLSISRLVIQSCPEILRITPSIYENAIQMWQPTYAKRSK